MKFGLALLAIPAMLSLVGLQVDALPMSLVKEKVDRGTCQTGCNDLSKKNGWKNCMCFACEASKSGGVACVYTAAGVCQNPFTGGFMSSRTQTRMTDKDACDASNKEARAAREAELASRTPCERQNCARGSLECQSPQACRQDRTDGTRSKCYWVPAHRVEGRGGYCSQRG